MELSSTGAILGGQLIKALGNTLMHSLWQGILLAVAGGLIISLTRKQSAALRYNLLLAAMLLFTVGVMATFLWQLQPTGRFAPVHPGSGAVVGNLRADPQFLVIITHDKAQQGLGGVLFNFFNRYCNTIVMLWFLIICIKSVKLAAGVHEIYQLRRVKISAVAKYWEDKVTQLSAQLKIKQAIGLAESGIARVPMVIGHLKPLILIPVGFINALSADEVEAILVHELAHIRRRDYLVNLLQSFMEIVFFFNPAVLWISQLIKAERENCCDDIALGQTNSKYGYIQALLACQEYQPAPGLGMAIASGKSSLLDRVKRIVNNNNQSLNIMEKTLLTIGLVAAGICTVAFSAKKEIKSGPKHHIAVSPVKPVTVAPKAGNTFKTDNKTNIPNNANPKTGNGNGVQDVKPANRPQIDALQKQNEQSKPADAAADTSKGKTLIYKPSDFEDGTTIHVVASRGGKRQMAYLFKRNGTLYQVFTKGGRASALYVNGEEKPVSEYQSKIDALLDEYDEIAVAPLPPIPPMAPMKPMMAMASMAAMKPMAPMAPMTAMTPMSPMAPMVPMTPLPPMKPDTMFRVITKSLIKQGVIKDEDNFDLDITNKYLVVDGVKQSEELHKQVLDKLVKKPGDKVNWHYSNHN